MHRPVIALAAVLATALPLAAQDAPQPLGPGDRLRVTAPQVGVRRLPVTLEAVRGDTLYLRPADAHAPLVLFAGDLRRVERSRGVVPPARSGARGMKVGALVGAGLGVGAGVAASTGSGEGPVPDPLSAAVTLGLAGGVMGGLVGAAAGTAAGGEQWQTVAPPYAFTSVAPPEESASAGSAGPAGTCIRLTAPGLRNVVAVVRAVEGDTVVLDDPEGGEALRVAVADVRRMHVWGGARSRGRAAASNGVRGALLGAAVGAALGYAAHEEDKDDWVTITPNGMAAIGAVSFGATGGGLGILGGVMQPGNRWTRIDPAALATLPAPSQSLPGTCPARRT